MGLSITAIGKGSPGHNGVPGDTFDNKELLKHLQKGLRFWQRGYLWINSSQLRKAERALEILEKKTGVRKRQMFISDTLYPNETLGTAAALDAITNKQVKDPKFDPRRDIDGFILVTDTRDLVFPVGGKAIIKALGIKPKHFANSFLACSSVVNAIFQAGAMFMMDKSCKTVLIVASDVTSRLHQPSAKKQPFLFGDQAVAFFVERTDSKGGFKISNTSLDPNAPDIVHVSLYTGDQLSSVKQFEKSDFGNDYNLKLFGDYESKSIAGLYRLYLENGSQDSNSHDMYIVPQVSLNVLRKAAEDAEVDCSNYEGRLVPNTVTEYGITGAAGTPLAMYMLDQKSPISKTPYTAFISAIGGLNAMFTYDPNANEEISMGYEIIPERLLHNGKSNGKSDGNGFSLGVKVATNGSLKVEPEYLDANYIASEIWSNLRNHPQLVRERAIYSDHVLTP